MTKRPAAKKPSKLKLITPLLIAVVIIGFIIFILSLKRPICGNTESCLSAFKVENGAIGVFNGKEFNPPAIDLAQKVSEDKVLGREDVSLEKHIYVDLTTQTLRAYQGDDLFMEVPVSTGKSFPTPTGDFKIWEKLRSTRMSGGSGADYYNLPNVPYTMFYYNDSVAAGRGFSIHGTYWHNNFGHAMSHGCVNMRTIDAAKLYDWVGPVTEGNVTLATDQNPGTIITIYGEAP